MRFFLYVFLFVTSTVHAEEIFPPTCKPIAIQGETALLPAGKPRLIMLHNLSKFDLWITHPMTEQNNNTAFSSRLQSNNWSALAIGSTILSLSCIESKPGHEQQIACQQTLALCEWPITTQKQNKNTAFFAGENMTLPSLTAYITRLGFELPQKAE
ncbi:MAG: hypothetical protein K0U24_08625 [Gammaproteobacteria bacterium]|nr:hypothetical protein [Gammaproteobacteria bacterium]